MKHKLLALLATVFFSLSAEAQSQVNRPFTPPIIKHEITEETNSQNKLIVATGQPPTVNGTNAPIVKKQKVNVYQPSMVGDVRTVSGIQVSLEPIHKWEQNKKGERPMKHWKYIQFEAYLGLINGGHCFNVILDGERQTILLQNAPATVLALATRVRNLEIQLGRATFIAQQAEANKTAYEGRVSSGWIATGDAEWINSIAYQDALLKQNAANARAFAQLTDAQRKELEFEFMSAQTEFQSRKELAMFTGRIIMQRELWDVGIKK